MAIQTEKNSEDLTNFETVQTLDTSGWTTFNVPLNYQSNDTPIQGQTGIDYETEKNSNPNSYSLRFNPPKEWYASHLQKYNCQFFGLIDLVRFVSIHFRHNDYFQKGAGSSPKKHSKIPKYRKMLEIGSWKGESTKIFASSGVFDKIVCVDPFEGTEEANKLFLETWNTVKEGFKENTKMFKDKIELVQGYSYEVAGTFLDNDFDFMYIDGSHKYEDVVQDINLYWNKLKPGGYIAGHDYFDDNGHPGVKKAIYDLWGRGPDWTFDDGSWLILKNK